MKTKTYKTLLEELLKESPELSEDDYFSFSERDVKNFYNIENGKLEVRQIYSHQLKIPLTFDRDVLMVKDFELYRRSIIDLLVITNKHSQEIKKIIEVANALVLAQSLKCKEDLEKEFEHLRKH
jgi:hypothetical protein